MSTVLVLHGPNLNLLGTREPALYGSSTLEQIDQCLAELAAQLDITLETAQYNDEGALLERVHRAAVDGTRFILINPAAFTHTSVALRDALTGVGIPFIEVHLSNIHAREPFRQHSFLSDVAEGVICGLGAQGYELAMRAAARRLDSTRQD